MEVIYTGLHQTPEQIVEPVIQEDADAIGLSILSGAHMTLAPRIMELLAERGRRVVVILGGTIPADDIIALKELGVAEVFTPGAPPRPRSTSFAARSAPDGARSAGRPSLRSAIVLIAGPGRITRSPAGAATFGLAVVAPPDRLTRQSTGRITPFKRMPRRPL